MKYFALIGLLWAFTGIYSLISGKMEADFNKFANKRDLIREQRRTSYNNTVIINFILVLLFGFIGIWGVMQFVNTGE
ncbi:MAG: hypothetical protein KAS32_15995 [Candidatus Peribacteraceae bacterium]|nr:hypothetical protein [Candidatus Peribacteraceae bacterium]